MDTRTSFSKKVIHYIQRIPKGRVATYGQIAKLAGKPHGARGVSWLIHSCSKTYRLPWQRVVNSKGKISIPVDSAEHVLQRQLLQREGVAFEDGRIDLNKFLWSRK